MTDTLIIAALLFVGVTIIVFRDPIARYSLALGIGIAWWMAERAERAMHARNASKEIEEAAHYSATHPTHGAQKAGIWA